MKREINMSTYTSQSASKSGMRLTSTTQSAGVADVSQSASKSGMRLTRGRAAYLPPVRLNPRRKAA